MYIKINDININYEFINNKKSDTIVFLHGWGQNIEMMKPLGQYLIKEYNILYLDLPGFGFSEEPLKVYTVYDYVEIVRELIKIFDIDKPTLIGHSFGGKIALLYASLYKVNKLVVMGSPYDIEIKKLTLKVKILKLLKKIPILNKLENFAKRKIGSEDYKNASIMMRKILTETVNCSIKKELFKIDCPTIIIWGTHDIAVDINYAYELEKIIPNSAVIRYEGATHYAYLERLEQTRKVIEVFLKSEE